MMKIDYKIALKNFFVKARLINIVTNLYRYTHFIYEGNPFREMRRNGKAPIPKTLIYEPTMRCNLNCSMCYLNTHEIAKSGEMTTGEIEKMVANLPTTIEHISVTGGEPTLRTDLKEILTFFKQKGFSSITLMTNGTTPKVLKELLQNDLISAVQLSLDGPENIHNSIRNSSKSYNLFVESLNLLRQYKHVYIYILAVISEKNLSVLPEITERCKGSDIVNLTFEFEKRYDKDCIEQSITDLKPWFNLKKEGFLLNESESVFPNYSLPELKKSINEAEKKAKKINFHNQYLPYSFLKNLEYYYYRKLRNKFKLNCRHLLTPRIDPQGNIIPCFGVREPFGNIIKDPLEVIWNNERFCLYRKVLLENNLLPICETCHRAESFDINFGRIN